MTQEEIIQFVLKQDLEMQTDFVRTLYKAVKENLEQQIKKSEANTQEAKRILTQFAYSGN